MTNKPKTEKEYGKEMIQAQRQDKTPKAGPLDARSQHNFPLTQLGNAERLISGHGSRLRHCSAWNKWLVWDGRRWKLDETGHIDRLAQRTVRSITRVAQGATAELKEALRMHAKRSETKTALHAMVDLACSQEGVAVTPREFDGDPFLLNCLNGTLDLRTESLKEHDQRDLIMKLAPVQYDRQASCPP